MKLTTEQYAQFEAMIPCDEWLNDRSYGTREAYAYAMASDAYKDAFGVRCRWMSGASVAECAEVYYDCVAAMRQEAAEAAAEEAATQAATQAAFNPAPFGTAIRLP